MSRYSYGDSVFIYSGKYMSYIGSFIECAKDSKIGSKMAKVSVDLSPEPVVRAFIIRVDNFTKYTE